MSQDPHAEQTQLLVALQALSNQHEKTQAAQIKSIKARINEKLGRHCKQAQHNVHAVAVRDYQNKLAGTADKISHVAKDWTDKLAQTRIRNDQLKHKTSALIQQISTNRHQIDSIRQETWNVLMNALLGPQVSEQQQRNIEHQLSVRSTEMAKQYATATIHHPVHRSTQLLDALIATNQRVMDHTLQ